MTKSPRPGSPDRAEDARTPLRAAPPDRDAPNRLKLRHLRFLVALDDHRKLHRAADEINITQPAASKMLGEIEAALGVTLFERLPRGVEPTGYGEVLIRRARTMLSELAKAQNEIVALRSGTGGAVSIGTVMAPAVEAVHEALSAIRPAQPQLRISVDVETSDELVRGLLASRYDFVVARIPDGIEADDLDYLEAQSEVCALVVRKGHPLAAVRPVHPAELAGRDWVLQPPGSLLRRNVEAMLRRNGLPPPDRVLDTRSTLMTLVAVSKTDAVTAVAEPVARLIAEAVGAFAVLETAEPISVEPYGLIRVRGRPLSPSAELVYEAVRAALFAAPGADGAMVQNR